MIFGQDRDELRRMYTDAWRKAQAGEMLTPLETQIAQVVREHPECQDALDDNANARSFDVAEGAPNPFLHMGLHLALREQLATDRPPGIRKLVTALAAKAGGMHDAEHLAIECLAETLWEAQRDNRLPDEKAYLLRLRRL